MSEPAPEAGGGAPTPTPAAPAPAPTPDPAPERTFTQADVDRIVTGRLAKFSDYDELRARAESATNAPKPEDVERARTEGAAEARQQLAPVLVAAEVRAAAAGLGFRDPVDALAQLQQAGKLAGITVTDTTVDGAAVKTELEQLAKDKPYLLKEPQIAPPGAAGIGAGGSPTDANVTPGLGRLQAAYAASTTTH